jgi:branched-chain amino acid transport system permease protein
VFASNRITPAEWVLLAALAALVAVLPLHLELFDTVQVAYIMIFGLLALSLDLIWGLAGVMSFGQSALFGVGAYAYGVMAINSDFTIGALLAGIATAVLFAAVIGYVTFYGRVGSIYFSVITLTVTLILYQVAGHTAGPEYTIGKALIGGYNGMTNIPSLGFDLPSHGSNPLEPGKFFRVCGFVLVSALVLCRVIAVSHFGRTLVAIRENERRVELTGYDPRWRKLTTFSVSAALAGLAGGLFASWGNFVSPEVFSLPQSALVVIWVLVGGRGTLYGAVIGGIVVQYLTTTIGEEGANYTTLALGLALIAMVLLFRRGLAPSLLHWAHLLAGNCRCRP